MRPVQGYRRYLWARKGLLPIRPLSGRLDIHMTVKPDGAFTGIFTEPSRDHLRQSNAASVGQLYERRTPRFKLHRGQYSRAVLIKGYSWYLTACVPTSSNLPSFLRWVWASLRSSPSLCVSLSASSHRWSRSPQRPTRPQSLKHRHIQDRHAQNHRSVRRQSETRKTEPILTQSFVSSF